MLSPVLQFRLEDENDQIPVAAIKAFHLYTSIHTAYPSGYLVIDDPDGRLLAYLAIRPGSLLVVRVIDESEGNTLDAAQNTTTESPAYNLTPLVVVGIENTDDDDLELQMMNDIEDTKSIGTLGGQVRVHLAHPWALYSDWSTHGYVKRPISEIVREIVQNTSGRGFGFASLDIGTTDDGTDGPTRYKLQESEASFIKNKLLPYALIGDQPVYSFVDEMNNFHFQSFSALYENNDPEITLIAPLADAAYSNDLLVDAKNPHSITDGFWFIGRNFKDQLPVLKHHIYIEDSESQVSFKALSRYRAPVPGYTLLKKAFVAGTDSLASHRIPFRFFTDGVRYERSRARVMNEFFEIAVETTMCVDRAIVGGTAELRLLGLEPGETHWANGKWLVTATEQISREGAAVTKLLLAKPAIESLPDILNPNDYYQLT